MTKIPTDEHERLIEDVAHLLRDRNIRDSQVELWRDDARAVLALIAKRTKDATQDMVLAGFGQLDREVTPHAAEDCWLAMHAASALWPKTVVR